MTDSLEQIVADLRSDAQALRRTGHEKQAAHLEGYAGRIAGEAGEAFMRWLSEDDAAFRSGRPMRYWRRQFAELERAGNAELRGRKRFYRMCVVTPRANTSAAREAGQRAARGESAA